MNEDIKELRTLIDKIDESLINLLSSRTALVEQIGDVKKDLNIAVLDKKREDELLGRLRTMAKSKKLDTQVVDSIYEIILHHSKKQQDRKSVLKTTGTTYREKGISKKIQNIMVSSIKEMRLLAEKYNDVISFGQGIPYLDTPEQIRKKLAKLLLEKDISKYTSGLGILELRKKLAKKLSKEYNIDADPEREILITVGAMEAVSAAILTVVDPGDEVILFDPGFSSHIELVLLSQGLPIFSELNKKNWQIDVEDVKKKITKKTKAIVLSSPNNPTGSLYSKEDLKKLGKLALENDLFIIADDPYNFLVFEGEYFSLSSLPEMKNNVISCFSFSKEYAMTGYRLGYVIAAENILNQMMKVHDAVNICAPAISQHAGIFALDIDDKERNRIRDSLKKNRDLIVKGLKEIKGLSFVKPQGAYYVLVKYEKDMNSVDLAIDILDKVKLTVIPGSAFGPSGENHIRLSFGCTPENIEEGLKRLKKYFDTY